MNLLKKYISKGDFCFSLLLAYYSCLFTALQQTTFNFQVLGRLVFDYLTWVVLYAVLLALIEYLRKEPLFGKQVFSYFPWKLAFGVSVVLSLLICGSYAFTGDTTLTTQRVCTLGIGFVGSVIAIMVYLRSLEEK